MSLKQGLILGVVFLVIALAGSAGISYGVVELSGAEGPQGEQGPPGEQGLKGSKGAKGATGFSGVSELGNTQFGVVLSSMILGDVAAGFLRADVIHQTLFPRASAADFDTCISWRQGVGPELTGREACENVSAAPDF